MLCLVCVRVLCYIVSASIQNPDQQCQYIFLCHAVVRSQTRKETQQRISPPLCTCMRQLLVCSGDNIFRTHAPAGGSLHANINIQTTRQFERKSKTTTTTTCYNENTSYLTTRVESSLVTPNVTPQCRSGKISTVSSIGCTRHIWIDVRLGTLNRFRCDVQA